MVRFAEAVSDKEKWIESGDGNPDIKLAHLSQPRSFLNFVKSQMMHFRTVNRGSKAAAVVYVGTTEYVV